MSAACRAFLERLVDYTGLFPPASLPAETAIRNFIDYLVMPESWLIGRFTCPAVRLEELVPFLEDPSLSRVLPLALSIQVRSGNDPNRFLENFQADAACVGTFVKRIGSGVRIESYEARLPAEVAASTGPAKAEALAEDMLHYLEVAGAPPRPLFLEVGSFQEYHVPIKTAIRALATLNRTVQFDSAFGCGLKIRCGGARPEDAPSPDQLCYTLITLVKFGVPFKAVGGLHNAFRRYNPQTRARTFGFLSLITAALLAATGNLDPLFLRKVLVSDGQEEFRFKKKALTWREHTIPLEEIARLRANFAIAVGTSSFADLRHALVELKLL